MGVGLLLRFVYERVSLLLLALVLSIILGMTAANSGASRATREIAVTAKTKTLSLNDFVRLHLIGLPKHTLNERGTASGTLNGSVAAQLVAISNNRGSASVTIYVHGGTLSGRAITQNHVAGAIINFQGSLSITGGSGIYAHASGTGLKFTGTFNRQNFRISAQVYGKIRA